MERYQINPHDHLFRFAFSQPEVAQDFVTHYLPADISRELDVDTLSQVEGTFIDETLDKHLSDALFRVNLRSGGEGLIYILIEHKSYPDRMTARQVMRYVNRIWRQEERAEPNLKQLPPILPVVFYHGQGKWNVASDLLALIDAPEAFLPYMPRMRYLLWDLNETDTTQLVGSVKMQLMLRLMELFSAPDLVERSSELAALLHELKEPKTVLEWVKVGLYYLAASPQVGREEFVEIAGQLVPDEGKDEIMSIAEIWFRDGLEQGLEQGIEQGLEQGIEQGLEQGLEQGRLRLLEAVTGLLTARFGPLPSTVETQLSHLTMNQLQEVNIAVLDFTDLDDLRQFVQALSERRE